MAQLRIKLFAFAFAFAFGIGIGNAPGTVLMLIRAIFSTSCRGSGGLGTKLGVIKLYSFFEEPLIAERI